MTMPNDPTAPVPVSPQPGGDPTMPVTPSSGAPTVAAQPGYGAGPGGRSPGGGGTGRGGGANGDPNGFDMSKLWWILLLILIFGILIGVIVALLSGGDAKKSSTTRRSTTTSSSTSTSTSTSSTSSTTTTTTASGPQVQQFTVNQNPVTCPNASATVQVTLVWSTQNANSATISIDNPNGPYGTYGPTGQQQVPFTCSVVPIKHTYYLSANGTNNQKVQKSIVVTGNVAVASSTTSSTML